MKHILVTGCAGFIGSHLTEQLLRRGYRVTGVDCFTPNYAKWIKQQNLEKCRYFPQFTFIKGDLRSLDLQRLLQDKDFVFHQAALPGVRSSWGKDFKAYVEHNLQATQRLLEAMKGSQVQKLIYASSSSVYGYLPEGPIPETQSPDRKSVV